MVTLRFFVLLGATLVGRSYVNSEASIGCLFAEDLCDKHEWCFDDNVFGRCLAQFGTNDQTNFYRYDLEKDMLKKLEHEMRRLFRAGYRWSHAYTQCILQNLLFSHRFGVDYNPSLCQGEAGLDETIDLLKTDPKDMAVIHFSPSRIDRHSDFADEWFMPPLHREKSHQPQHYGNAKKYPQDMPSSEGLSSQGKHKRLHLDPADMTNQQLMDLFSLLNAQQVEEEQISQPEEQNTRNAQQSENDYIDSILNRLSPEELEELQNILEAEISNVQENLENGGYNNFPSNRIRNSISEDDQYRDNSESFDNSNGLDASFWDGGFKRLHRYDVKKPGPNFMTNLDDFDSTEAVVNEQLQQASLFKLLDDMMQQQQKNDSVIDQELTADGMVNTQNDGEERSASVEEGLELNSAESDMDMEARSAGETSKRKQDDPAPKGKVISHNLYGVPPPYIPPDNKPDNTNDFDVVDTSYAYIIVEDGFHNWQDGAEFLDALKNLLQLPPGIFSDIRVEQDQVTFKVNPNVKGVNASQIASKAESMKTEIQSATGKSVTSAGIGNQVKISVLNLDNDKKLFIVTFVVCGCVAGIVIAVAVLYIVRRHARSREKLQTLGHPDTEPSHDYQDLCRQRMANKNNEKPEPIHAAQRVTSLSRENESSARSPSSRSSTSSWSEEPVTSNMDISTGHMVLSYMEDHLKNKDRLEQEWVALCAYEAEPCSTSAASQPDNLKKNRYVDVLPYDHSRVVLNDLTNMGGSDYINASTITDHDPRNPAYIATQGPLPHTSADFWQMVWEQGSVVIVTLTRLVENGVAMCHRYWPEEGSELYHIYEVHLVSEHIWCDDYLVRSFYLKNLKTGETRTVTQFHFLSWPDNGVPVSVKALLDFRRKMNKSYRGRSCPIVVHCSDGSGRTGTYTLIDMVLNRMAKGAKEIDIAATLEHIRDQRHLMVKTKGQFEFALMAVAEEVHAILKAMPQ